MDQDTTIAIPILHFIGLQDKIIGLLDENRGLRDRIEFLEHTGATAPAGVLQVHNAPAGHNVVEEAIPPGYVDASRWKQRSHLASVAGGLSNVPGY